MQQVLYHARQLLDWTSSCVADQHGQLQLNSSDVRTEWSELSAVRRRLLVLGHILVGRSEHVSSWTILHHGQLVVQQLLEPSWALLPGRLN